MGLLCGQVVQRRVDLMAEEGVRFETSTDVGKDVGAAELLSRFDALLLTTGSTWPRDLPIPGRCPSPVGGAPSSSVDGLHGCTQGGTWRASTSP